MLREHEVDALLLAPFRLAARHDDLANLAGGARYLRSMLDQFGRVDLALAAYNAGPGRVQRVGRIPDIVETQLYVVRVLERYERLGG